MPDENKEVTAEEIAALPVEENLEKLRDDKCIPVAHKIMHDMADEMIGTDGPIDARPLALKALQHFFDADLVIATEASYVPQLILGALSGLNATVQTCEYIQPDMERYGRVAKEILGILADADIDLLKNKPEEIESQFAGVKEQINTLFADEKLNALEVKFIMDLIFDSFTAFNNTLSGSLESSSARAEAKLFGIGSMDELTVRKLDSVLKE